MENKESSKLEEATSALLIPPPVPNNMDQDNLDYDSDLEPAEEFEKVGIHKFTDDSLCNFHNEKNPLSTNKGHVKLKKYRYGEDERPKSWQVKDIGLKITCNLQCPMNPFDFSLKIDDKISIMKSHGIKTGRRIFDSYVSKVEGDNDKTLNKREEYSKKACTVNVQKTVDSPVILRKITQLSRSMKLQENSFQCNLKRTCKELDKYYILKDVE